jgi:hypothetical protein
MGNFKVKCRTAALFFVGWTLVSVIFAGISYAAAIGENNKEFGFISALRLNLVQFYVWAILSPLAVVLLPVPGKALSEHFYLAPAALGLDENR